MKCVAYFPDTSLLRSILQQNFEKISKQIDKPTKRSEVKLDAESDERRHLVHVKRGWKM